jgi:hypothetical protein
VADDERIRRTARHIVNGERETGTPLPIVCTLKPGELEARRDGLLTGLMAKASAQEQIPGGFRWRFDPDANLAQEVGAVIDAEHQCCRFLQFQLLVEPGDGPMWLEVTGPPGTEDFLSALR